MDRKDDDKHSPGSSGRKLKKKHLNDSPKVERKKRRISIQKETLDATKSGDKTFTDMASVHSCGSKEDSENLSMDGSSDSTDSDCAMDQPSLLEQLKTILDTYQDAQIILELIQNADDASATEMQIMYVNDSEETTSGLYSQCGCYSEYFGVPALCVYNNAMFKKDDWKYIKSIYRSGKREDALKVGRYGLGFKSVFHMTDNPVIVSGDQLLIIDPFRTKNKLGNDCHTLKFKKLKKAVQRKRHYKQAIVAMETLYGHCGFTKESLNDGYHGTLFWFPLRRSASKLSTKVFNHHDVKELVAIFKKEAPCLPLFLKNITQVSFYNKNELFPSFSVTCSVVEKEEKASFHKKLSACKSRSTDNDIKAIFPVNVTVKDGKKVQTQRWVVCNYIKDMNSLSGALRTLAENKLSYSPFVGIAVPIDNTSDAKFHGHVFCFLPLPSTGENYTGLPVHINGFFALSQDRHHVKWPTDNQTEREDETQRWNRFLCEEVIVDAYTNTLDYMKKLTVKQNCIDSDNLVYKILPLRPNVRPNWDTIVDPLYRSLKNKDMFYTRNNGGKWVQPKDAVFSILKWNEDEFINVREKEQCIVDILLDCQHNVVNVPSNVADMFPEVARITPKYLRNVMRERPIYTRLSSKHKLNILQFILADRQYSDLSDIQLLPLEDEKFCVFGKVYPKYICKKDEIKLFPGIEQNFVKLDISQTILSHLKEMQREGIFDLRNLNHEEFPSLLGKTLSANGNLDENGCLSIITNNITMKWLDKIFGYIHHHEIPLETVENMFLVPVIDDTRSGHNFKLMALKGRYVVANCDRMKSLDRKMRNALSNLNVTVLEHIPKGETYTELMGTYCKYPEPEGIFELLEGLHDDSKESRISLETTILLFNKRSKNKEKQALLNFLSKDRETTSQKVDSIIRQLEIFPETSNVDNDVKYTSISKNGGIACRNCIPVKYHTPLLHLNIPQKNLAERLGATEVSEGKIVEEILGSMVNCSTGYKRSCIERFMMYVLDNLNNFGVNQTNILDFGSRIEFIEVLTALKKNEVAPIGRFFDHTDRNLQELFHFDKSQFLPTNYQVEALEPALRKFGLKSEKEVKTEDVHHVVQILDKECRKKKYADRKIINKCSLQVMKLLEKMASNSRNNLDTLQLEGYRWITFIRNKPSHYPDILPWYGNQFESLLCSPEDISSNKHELISASVKCIAETSDYPYLAERYGWTNPPSAEICILQLEAVKKVFCIKHKATLMFIIKCIYEHMSDHIESSVERLKLPLERLKTQAIVCTGGEFRLPKEVFISFPENENIHLEPFLHKLPVEFLEFSPLFVLLGSTAELTVSSFKSILTTIKATTSTSNTKRDRKIVIHILECIASLKDADTSLNDVLVPVNSDKASLVLHPVEECAYCDKESSLLAAIDGDSNVRFIHSDVSVKLAESLGIQSFIRKYMSDGGMEEMYSACGQSEPLTTRLKHVLENYPDGLAVLKELVQNADDAGAQHISFLYDERQNKNARTGLIDGNMAKCQGPALWAYNNAQFTEVDFQNIVKLGGETKKETKTKIGKFGLGFCAVYNLTDVPSFLSGSSLVIFDPHTTYLGKAIKDKSSPGIRLTFTEKNSGILKLWRNQFRPYNKIFGCDLTGDNFPPKFGGTLFRLPLRTKEQALKSAIKCTPYCRDDVVTLLCLLKDCAGSLLTFTQNIKEIKLFHLTEDSKDPANDIQLIFSADKGIIETQPIFTNPANVNVMREVEKACSRKHAFTYIERISVKMHMTKARFLGVERSYVKSSPWLVAWASGTGPVLLEHSVRLESEGALPLGSIAVSLKENPSGFTIVPFPHREKLPGFYNRSRLFCFLPLPVECKTPVHINGCFAVSSDRKDLVKRTSDEKGETNHQIWNRMLISDAVCNAYIVMLTSLDQFGVSAENYSSLWPIINEKDNNEEKSYLAYAFCKKVISSDLRIFYTTRGRQASFSDCVFLENGFRHKNKVGSIAFEICQRFYHGTKVLMDMSEPLYRQFCMAGCKEELQQKTMTMKTFFEDIMFPNITQLDGKKRDALVMFILKENHHLHQLLISNPCIPVHPNDQLRFPNELIRPQSKVSALFCKEDGRFPSDSNQPFCSESIFDILVDLGMMEKTLTDELVVERATSIAKLSDPEKAIRRCRKLLAYLDRQQTNCQQIINNLSTINFIPSLQKPRHWPLSWVSTNSAKGKVTFCPPNQMFFPSQMYRIACSQLIADTEGLKCELKVNNILQLLGVRDNVSHNDVEAQLMAISKVRCGDLSNMQRSTLHSICLSVYEFLNNSPKKLSRKYNDLPIIWMSNQLIPPSHATLSTFRGIDCTPAIYQLGTSDVTKYTNFLRCVGIQETLTKENVITVLANVQKDNKSQRLENVNLTVSLLQLLVLVCERFRSELDSEEKSRIFIPDDANVLRLAVDLCVDDEYPLKRQPFMHFVNRKISGDIIQLLDIKSKRVKHLNNIKGSMPFGQKEVLVKRLKGILEGYPRDEAILYELLQNADDAGAKEIMFIEDMRQHEAKKGLFCETWSAIQGPALCVFNDSCFTTENLQGICKLGEGSKSQDPTTTGQFGIGFNVVYHLTDAPSFITRGPTTPNQGTFCIFDPHCKFCPVADDDPGLQLPDLKELEETYPGVYECYLQKELPRKQGTWFRFPLRNNEMARNSLICDKPMHRNVLNELLQKFKENMKKCLLFLRNIRKISLCEIDRQGNIKINAAVESNVDRNDERNLGKFSRKCDTLTKALRDRSVDLQNIEMQTIKYNMKIHERLSQPECWIIAQTFGFDSNVKLAESVRTAFECGDIALAPKGAVALPCISEERDAGARTKTNYKYIKKRFNTPVPKNHDGQGQDPLLTDGPSNEKSKFEGQAFCLLPLPMKTGLPVHVNGHFALVQTRGSLWEKSHRGDWNKLIFETAISSSYVLAVEHLRDSLLTNGREKLTVEDKKSSLENYHQVFPQFDEGKSDFIKCMITSFFSIMYEKESAVFPVLSHNASQIWWVALQKRMHEFPAYFNNLPDQFKPAIEPNTHRFRFQTKEQHEDGLLAVKTAHQLSDTLIDIGMKLLESPLWIFNSMVQALQMADNLCGDQLEKHLVQPNIVIKFLRTYTSSSDVCLLKYVNCRVTDTPVKSIENMERLLGYCIKDSDNFKKYLEHLPLLVTNDAILRKFSPEQPVFLSPFCDLLPKSAKELVHRNLVPLLFAIQLQNCQCLKSLDLNSFSHMLPQNFDTATLSAQTPIRWNKQTLPVKWIREFWQYMDSLENINVQALRNWCLIPGNWKTTEQDDGDTDILVPCDKGYVLVNNSSFPNELLRKVLISLNIPTPHIKCNFSKTMRDMVASQQDPVRLVECLHYHRDNLKYLEMDQCKVILEHLSEPGNIAKLREQSSVVNKIKDLPLFTTVNGINVTIQTPLTKVYILREPSNLPKEGIYSWATKCGYILLEKNYLTSELMSFLNCKNTISVPELYCRHILPRFHLLEQIHHLTHLTYIREMLRNDPNCPFKEALRTSKFIYHNGSLKPASCFYSPHNRLCRMLCDQSMLPPHPFGNEEWNTLMVCAGMKETVSEDLFITFATQIETNARSAGMTPKIKEQSREIVKFLFATDDFCKNTAFLERIKRIRFVEPYVVPPDYQGIMPQFGCEDLIQFCDSVPQSLSTFVWSNTPVLPRYVHTNLISLGILREPPLPKVLSHTHNVCDSINKKIQDKKRNKESKYACVSESFIDSLMTKIYEYLQKHCIGNPETKRMLSETPLVHIREEEICVMAKQVSVGFDGNKPIPPHLVEIPLQYGRYKELFQFVGTTDSVTLSQYSEVLRRIQVEVKSNMLGPDHIRDVLTALKSIMMLLEKKELAEIEKSMEEVETLFLPTSDKRLAKSTDLVFADKLKLRSRIMQNDDHGILFMHSLKDCHKQENLILKLPENLKPKILSSIVQECLLSSSNNTQHDKKVEQLGAFLASSRFLNVVKKIGKFSDEDFDSYRQRLLRIQLVSLSEITTFLTVDGRQIPGTEIPQECFYSVEKSETKLYFVANDHVVRSWLQDVGQKLVETLSDCLGDKIPPEKIRILVDYMDSPDKFKKYSDELLDEEENDEDESLVYFPGKLVPLGLHQLLENEITLLNAGDLVAYEKFDPLIDGDEPDSGTGAVFIFVRILTVLPAASPEDWLQKYEVSFGQGITETVARLRLYKIKYPEISTTTELVLHQFGHDSATPLKRDNIFDEIIVTLSHAWELDKKDRKRIMKRLLLIWHPDKNCDKGSTHESFCKDVTQFILDIIQRLDKGERFLTTGFNSTDGQKGGQKRKRNYSDWRYGNCSEELRAFGDRVSSMQRENQRHFSKSFAGKGQYAPNPQPAEAKRWFRQAEMDFQCGVNSLKMNSTTECCCQRKEDYNWICFKFHQACEKACKAYMFCIDERKVTHSHNLRSIIPSVAGNEQLADWLQAVETLVGNYSKMRYPDVMDYPKIPGTSYTKEQATTMKELTTKIMDDIENKL